MQLKIQKLEKKNTNLRASVSPVKLTPKISIEINNQTSKLTEEINYYKVENSNLKKENLKS